MMQKCRVNVCHFCFSPSTKFYELKNCIDPPIHARFDSTTQIHNVLEKILRNDAAEELTNVCVRCNDKFQQIYTFLDSCSKSVSPSVNTAVRISKQKTTTDRSSIGRSSQLSILPRKEDRSGCSGMISCEASQISKFKRIKKVVVRLKRLKVATFAIKVKPECDSSSHWTSKYSSAENVSDTNVWEANLKGLKCEECPQIEDIKSEILEEIHTEDYQITETSNASKNFVQNLDETLNCSQCDKGVTQRSALKTHLDKCQQNIHTTANVTSLKFQETAIVSAHLNKTHGKRETRQQNGIKKRFKCDQCGKDFTYLSYLKRHLLLHQNVTFPCEFCDAKFTDKCQMVQHMRLHTGETFNCSQCDKRFVRPCDLKAHHQSHLNKYKCEQCEKVFRTPIGLNLHLSSYHLNVTFQCDICGKKFRSKGAMSAHRRFHTGATFDCEQCDRRFVHKCRLRQHIAACHTKIDQKQCDPGELSTDETEISVPHVNYAADMGEENKSQPDRSKSFYKCEQCEQSFTILSSLEQHLLRHQNVTFPCEFCDAKFTNKSQMSLHRRMHTGKTSFNCSKCSKRFMRRIALQKHHQRIHSAVDEKKVSKKKFKCEQCDKHFDTRISLKSHKHRMHKNKQYKCDHCHMKFMEISYFEKHILIHQKGYLKCDQCGKSFSATSNLKRHKKIHGNRIKYKCEQCKKIFISRFGLNYHLLSHEDVTFPCDICGKKFRREYDVSVHKRIHTGATFDCQQCHMRFIRNSGLKRHLAAYHKTIDMQANEAAKQNDRRFKCDECKKDFSGSYALKRHILIHQNVTFSCHLCDKIFSTKSRMLQHMRLHTGKTFDCNQCDKRFIRNDLLGKHLRICKKKIQVDKASLKCQETIVDNSSKTTTTINTLSNTTKSEDDLIEVWLSKDKSDDQIPKKIG